jgi:hypothetical protein
MLFALLTLAALPDLVPARWASNDPASLEILRGSPVNCLLLEEPQWSRQFNEQAAAQGISPFAVIHPGPDAMASLRKAIDLRFAGGVLEGSFAAPERTALKKVLSDSKLAVVELTLRSDLNLDGTMPVIGTFQGVWPGVQVEADGEAKSAPSGGPWIDTNTGFLRFVRAATTSTLWIANRPPSGKILPVERYVQAIGDAAMTGARWVLAFDDDFTAKLLARDKSAMDGWRRIVQVLSFYERNSRWRRAEPFGRLALVEDVDSGALLSGGILDMIAVKHTPVRPVPKSKVDRETLNASQMAVNVDPEALTPEQKEVLKAFTRAGGTLLTGPPGWKFPLPGRDQITLEKGDLKKLDDIWRELNSMTGRKNLGARLFNVSSMLSNLLEMPDHSELLLHLVNYSDFMVENVTVHVLGKYRSAKLYRPEGDPLPLSGYPVDDGTGFDIDQVRSVATLVLTR